MVSPISPLLLAKMASEGDRLYPVMIKGTDRRGPLSTWSPDLVCGVLPILPRVDFGLPGGWVAASCESDISSAHFEHCGSSLLTWPRYFLTGTVDP